MTAEKRGRWSSDSQPVGSGNAVREFAGVLFVYQSLQLLGRPQSEDGFENTS